LILRPIFSGKLSKRREKETVVWTMIRRVKLESGLRWLCRMAINQLETLRPGVRYLLRISGILAGQRLDRHIKGQLGQVSMTLLPLVAVVGLCVLMVGWRGKSLAQETQAPPSALPQPPVESSSGKALAAFQRQHVVHATIRVPQ
jgi:hypothetical protein